ncbi:hypothetical protein EVAR_12434_1 [Eumeta japonica]|uniref:Uncharacterized protein n=1 Tax=Eumeta variegata TaxID=151549 RepID=A0A4C1TZA4_EUMVA|nr:hypothetical protein EVAR_12434_1 [Eumeta japonica]
MKATEQIINDASTPAAEETEDDVICKWISVIVKVTDGLSDSTTTSAALAQKNSLSGIALTRVVAARWTHAAPPRARRRTSNHPGPPTQARIDVVSRQ